MAIVIAFMSGAMTGFVAVTLFLVGKRKHKKIKPFIDQKIIDDLLSTIKYDGSAYA